MKNTSVNIRVLRFWISLLTPLADWACLPLAESWESQSLSR